MKAFVDKNLCIGCGLCESMCPDVFEMQGTLASVKGETVPQGSLDCAKQMVSDCPVEAIKVEE